MGRSSSFLRLRALRMLRQSSEKCASCNIISRICMQLCTNRRASLPAGKECNFPQPSSEQLAGFQEGDPLVANEIVELVLPSILRWAWTHYKLLPQDDVQDIVHQVLAEICHHSARYDPERVLFTTYVIGL